MQTKKFSCENFLLINGSDDPLVPYNGGDIVVFGKNRGRVLSTDETMQVGGEAAG